MTGFAEAAAKLTPEQYAVQTASYYGTVFFWLCLSGWSICLWDALTRLPVETRLVYFPELQRLRKGQMPSLPPLLLFICRALAIPTIVTSFVFQRQPDNCQVLLRVTCAGLAFGTGSCLSIFAVRTIAIRQARWPLQVFLWINVAGILSLWLAWALRITVDQLPEPDLSNVYGPTCRNPGNMPDRLYVVYLWTALFDLMVLFLSLSATIDLGGLSLANARTRSRVMSPATKQFWTDAGLYFAGSFTVHLTEFAWVYTHQKNYLLLGCILPFHGVIIFVVGPRVVTNFRQTVVIRKDHLPSTNASGSKAPYQKDDSSSGAARAGGPASAPPVDLKTNDDEETMVPNPHSNEVAWSSYGLKKSTSTEMTHPFRTTAAPPFHAFQTVHTLSRSGSTSSSYRPFHDQNVRPDSNSHNSEGIKVQREIYYSVT